MMSPSDHESFMRETIALSRAAVDHGNEPFGALLVRKRQVVLKAENTVGTSGDATGHAEMNLVREAMRSLPTEDLASCILYTSTEPCAMCSGAIYWGGINVVVFGCSASRLQEIAGASLLMPSKDILEKGARDIEVVGPVLEEEAAAVHAAYW